MTPLASGSTLGDYTILDIIGAGAMGVVYRARDEQLHRTVAIKVLTESRGGTLRDQLLLEARAASSLAHPGICTIYGVDQVGGHDFIVMEFVDGWRLSDRIPEQGLSLDKVLDYGIQVAEALAHAHERGVVHRDLKSANVLITKEGRVKIVDFGLADRDSATPPEAATTPAPAATIGGGTLAYMAPEVLQGETPTAASDLWAFGVLLYEMAAGALPFSGRTTFELTSQIMQSPQAPLPAHVPVSVRTIIAHCLAKEPAERYRSAREVRAALEAVQSHAVVMPVPRPRSRGRSAPVWAGIAALLALSAIAWNLWPRATPAGPTVGGQLTRLLSSERQALEPVLSGDGSMLAYVAEDQNEVFDIFVSRVAGGDRVRITNDAARESHPRFSPDGNQVVFARRRPGERDPEICVVPSFGGQVSVVVANAGQPVWSPDAARLAFIRPATASAPSVLATARLDGSDERTLAQADGVYPAIRNPAWSPDGTSIVFVRSTGGIAGELWSVPVSGGSLRRISNDPPTVFVDEPTFSDDGRAIIHSSNRGGATNIWSMRADGTEPVRLTTGSGPDEAPSIDRTGRVAFINAHWRSELFIRRLSSSETRVLARDANYLWAPAMSPDGKDIAVSRNEADGLWHLWVVSRDDGAMRQLTSGNRGEIYSRWTPDSRFVLYQSWGSPRRVFRVPRDGGPAVALTPPEIDAGYADMSPDGQSLAYTTAEGAEERVYIQSLSGERPPRPLRGGPASVPRWSPDGRLIAFAPDRSYYRGIYVIHADGTGERQLTKVGGWPVWWPDGRHISYLETAEDGTQRISTVAVDGSKASRQIQQRFRGVNHPFDLSPDAAWMVSSDAAHVSSEIWVLQGRPMGGS
jgi:eukaryotic-like serine/threonine-protein kinase